MSNKEKGGRTRPKYQSTVYVGTVNGKKQFKYIQANTKKELERKRTALKNEILWGKDVYNVAYFGDWAAKWYADKKANADITDSAKTVIQGTIKHLNRYFGKTPLKDINLSMFQNMLNDLAQENPNTGKPAGADLLKKITSNAQAIFKYAAANNVAFVPSFFDSVTIPRTAAKKNRHALSEDEQYYIIDTPHRMQLPAMIMLFTGLRRGECLALSWSDINLKDGYIFVNKSIVFGKNQGDIKEGGKTANATRRVPMPPILVDYLTEYKNSLKAISPLVCVSESGKQYTITTWRNNWKSYMLDLNIKYGIKKDIKKHNPKAKATELPMKINPFDPHDLRHTYATMLFLQNIDVVTAMQLLGHGDIQTTVNIYADFKSLNKDNISEDYKQHLKTDFAVKTA